MVNDRQSVYRRVLAEMVVITICGAAIFYFLVSKTDGSPQGFRLRAETLIAEDGPIWPDETDCPDRQSRSPVEFSSASALADELRLYPGELAFAHIVIGPNDGAVPEQVVFEATWPAASVAADSPVCAFLVADDLGAPILSWRRIGARAAEFVVANPRPYGETTVEVWLQAERPSAGSVFSTSLSTEVTGDSIVVEPLGGRIGVDPRPSAVVSAELTSTTPRLEGTTFDLQVAIPNPVTGTLALDVDVTITVADEITWKVDQAPQSADCTIDREVRCKLGNIFGGEQPTINLTGTLPDSWTPTTDVACRTVDGRLQVGLCIIANVTTATGDLPPQTSELSLSASAPPDDPILVELVPDPLIVRRGETASVMYLVSSVRDEDLGSVELVGSDCVELLRIQQPLEDGDAFLEVGEVWQYDCALDATSSRSFRLDLAALTESAQPFTTTVLGALTVIDPAIEVTSQRSGERLEVIVTNTGDDRLTEIAVLFRDCSDRVVADGDTGVLNVGASISFVCERAASVSDDPVAYALDSSGNPISARPAPLSSG